MKKFMSDLNDKQRQYYLKLNTKIGITLDHIPMKTVTKIEGQLTDNQMFDVCRFNSRGQYSSVLYDKIKKYREAQTGNTCLHVASQFGNTAMMSYIIKNKIISPNDQNNRQDNSLIHALKYSIHQNFEKSIIMLARNTDLGIRDASGKLPFEVDLAQYTKARVRITTFLRQQYYRRLGSAQ